MKEPAHMERNLHTARKFTLAQKLSSALALGSLALLGLAGTPASAQSPPPFEESVYLYNQAYDTDLDNPGYASGNWGNYRAWLGGVSIGAESDPGWGLNKDGSSDWYDCCWHTSWNSPWGTMQQRYGGALPTVILGMGQMPIGYLPNDGNALDFENAQWIAEANGDPNHPDFANNLAYFANYAQEVDNGSRGSAPFNKVIIRLGYEFDGGWNPWGNLNVMSSMSSNYIKAWQNIVRVMRDNDPKGIIKFCWNPTDHNVQINSAAFYPGDAYVDYIGIDTYDYDFNNTNPLGYQLGQTPSIAQQQWEWTNYIQPTLNGFSYFASAASADSSNPNSRNGYIQGKSVPLVIGEWGTWQVADLAHPAKPDRPAGGDDPTYIQNMYDWMSSNNVAVECYFEAPADGISSLSGIFGPTRYPQSAALFKSPQLFGASSSPATVLPIGHRIGIKSQQTGYFASSDQGDSTFLKSLWSTSPGAWETYDVADAGGGNIALLCEQTGKYVSADLNQGSDGAPAGVLRADWATNFGSWETFQPVDQGNGVFGLKANNGLYVSCNLNDGDRLEAQWAQSVGAWEQFTYTDLGTDGSLTATDPPVTGTVNLTTLGTTDWAHWGYGSVGHLDHKAVSGVAVNKIKATLPSGAAAFTTTGAAYSWTGGTPTSAATASATAVSTTTGTFALTVPITRTKQTLSIYVGGANTLGVLKAVASDRSSRPYLDQVGSMKGVYNEVYTIAVAAGQPGQTLTVTWKRTQGTGTVALEAAALH